MRVEVRFLQGKVSSKLISRARQVQEEVKWFESHNSELCFSCFNEYLCWRRNHDLKFKDKQKVVSLRVREINSNPPNVI